jgi:hypothetical protein
MSLGERDFLEAEISTLKRFLAELPPDEVFERHGFQRRLETAQARLVELSPEAAPPEPIGEQILEVEGTVIGVLDGAVAVDGLSSAPRRS